MPHNEVNTAFEILLEEIEVAVNTIHLIAEKALKTNDHDVVKSSVKKAEQMTTFREKVQQLHSEWQEKYSNKEGQRKKKSKDKKTFYSKLHKGMRTCEIEFRQPILVALESLGGSADIKEVLKSVEKKTKNILKKVDYEALKAPPHETRWINTAQWCRNTLVKEGLLKSGSPRGVWELTEKGRKAIVTK